jgi:hypothetical protein
VPHETRRELTRVEDLCGGEPHVQGSWLDLEKVRQEFLALAQADLHWFMVEISRCFV